MFPLSETSNKFYRYFGLAMVVIIGVVSIVGSGGSGGGENPPPTITSVSPAQSSDSALVTALVEAQFSIDMDPMSFDDSSFLLAVNSSSITASNISYNAASKIATFVPAADLTSGEEYFAAITTAVRDSAGNNPLSTNYVWSFSVAPAILPVSTDVFGTIDTASPSTTSAISNDGRYIVFESRSPNIGCGSNTTRQICRKDTVNGDVTLVSSSGGLEGDTDSSSPVISSDGNYVAFVSTSSNLCGGAAGITQICRRNLTTGALELVSATAATPPVAGTSASSTPSISADGNYVAFVSTSSNLCGGAAGITQICRKNLTTGALELVSATAATPPVAGTSASFAPSISSDGNYVAFVSTSNNLCGGAAGITQICRKNLTSGAIDLVSEDLTLAAGTSASFAPSISSDGNYVAFVSTSNNLCGGAAVITQICRKNLTSGAVDLVSEDLTLAAGTSASSAPSISADGNYVAFVSTSNNLCGGAAVITQICLKDMTSGSGGPIQLISDANPDVPVVQASGPCTSPQISGNSRYISFTSNATNLGSGGSIDQIYRGAR